MTVSEPDRPARGRDGDSSVTARAQRSDHHPINWLLLVPLVLTLFPPLYNRIDPALADIPFFYWYQITAIVVSVAVTLIVFRKTRV